LSAPDLRVGHDHPYPSERAGPGPRRSPCLPEHPDSGEKETAVVLADLVIIVPAALAGVGGVLLGDRAGMWLKTALTGRRKD
jgi:hypothetical protein